MLFVLGWADARGYQFQTHIRLEEILIIPYSVRSTSYTGLVKGDKFRTCSDYYYTHVLPGPMQASCAEKRVSCAHARCFKYSLGFWFGLRFTKLVLAGFLFLFLLLFHIKYPCWARPGPIGSNLGVREYYQRAKTAVNTVPVRFESARGTRVTN